MSRIRWEGRILRSPENRYRGPYGGEWFGGGGGSEVNPEEEGGETSSSDKRYRPPEV